MVVAGGLNAVPSLLSKIEHFKGVRLIRLDPVERVVECVSRSEELDCTCLLW